MADTITTDVAIVGAGIAGAGLAADLAGDFDVVLLEQESRPGYHSTGRSAAIFIQNYGNQAIRALTRASAPLFSRPDAALFPLPLVSPRGLLYVAGEDGLDQHAALLAEGEGLRELSLDEARAMVPLLRPEWLRAAAYEDDAQDIDVAALHQGWLQKARAGGAQLLTDAGLSAARIRQRPLAHRDAGGRHRCRHHRQRGRRLGRCGGAGLRAGAARHPADAPHHGRAARAAGARRSPMAADLGLRRKLVLPSRRPAACKCRRTTRIRSSRTMPSSTIW